MPDSLPPTRARAVALGHPGLAIGGALTLLLVAVALLSIFWTPYPPAAIDIAHRLAPPSLAHPLGSDPLGRDVLSMLMAGARNSILIALVAVGIGAGLGVPLGALAASRGGLADEAVMRFNDLAFAFPALLSAVMITALAGPGAVNAIIAIGIFNIPVFARLTRAGALGLWRREFVLAARAIGKSRFAITRDHILPNIAGLLIVQLTIQFALAILAEAALSYLGLGTRPPQPSWGKMLYDAQTYIYATPRLAIFPGLAITLSVLGLNLLGDGLNDLLDPRLARRRIWAF
jgi:peptide/nickel transport system permease protein